MSELNLIFLGPPGAGKGTQASRLSREFHLPYIATGDMFRAVVKEGSELGDRVKEHMGSGGLVPDELTIKMLEERLEEGDTGDGFILDGFPRTVPQADALKDALGELGRHVTAILLIEVADEELIRRISGRRVCVQAGHTYHVESDPPKHEGVCDQDGSRLILRDDDKPETVKARLRVYHQQTEPLVAHYEDEGLLRRFDGTRTPPEVHDRIRATIATLKLEVDL